MARAPCEPALSVPVLLKRRAETDPDGLLIQDVRGPSITNAAFHEAALSVADALAALGVKRGDCVVTLNDARIEAHTCWMGLCWLGAMEVPVNPEFRGQSLIYGISDCRAKVLITSNAWLEKVRAIRAELPHIEHVLTLDQAVPEGARDVRAIADLALGAPRGDYPEPQLTDPYAVIYTSGTTGPSKAWSCPGAASTTLSSTSSMSATIRTPMTIRPSIRPGRCSTRRGGPAWCSWPVAVGGWSCAIG